MQNKEEPYCNSPLQVNNYFIVDVDIYYLKVLSIILLNVVLLIPFNYITLHNFLLIWHRNAKIMKKKKNYLASKPWD